MLAGLSFFPPLVPVSKRLGGSETGFLVVVEPNRPSPNISSLPGFPFDSTEVTFVGTGSSAGSGVSFLVRVASSFVATFLDELVDTVSLPKISSAEPFAGSAAAAALTRAAGVAFFVGVAFLAAPDEGLAKISSVGEGLI